MNLYELFILGVNIKYIVFSILYRHINVPMACKELMQVPQWAGLIPMGWRVELGPRDISFRWSHDTDTSYGPEFLSLIGWW